jgi:hypothetical protein
MTPPGKTALRMRKILQVWFGLAAAGFAGLHGLLEAAPRKIVLPAETAGFVKNSGVEQVMANCLTCHSAEYITTQPPLARAAWKASLEKMRGKYGAQIPGEQEAALLDYLEKSYGPGASQSR